MKLFHCTGCENPVFFDSFSCVACARSLGYIPSRAEMVAYQDAPPAGFLVCANAEKGGCNWLVNETDGSPYCFSCRLSSMVPDLSDEANLERWRRLEAAKRYFLYGVFHLGLPIVSRIQDPENGLAFELLADWSDDPKDSIMTGHSNGLITIDVAEADGSEREARRNAFCEPIRTLLGHYRHESGHYYWKQLVEKKGQVDQARAMFGDERDEYQQALKTYYANGPALNWQEQFISAYASSHPHEDFAESWAHYLHIADSLETAISHGLARIDGSDADMPFDEMIKIWIPLTVSVNALNRAMGQPDLYPFVLTDPVINKLRFIHDLIRQP